MRNQPNGGATTDNPALDREARDIVYRMARDADLADRILNELTSQYQFEFALRERLDVLDQLRFYDARAHVADEESPAVLMDVKVTPSRHSNFLRPERRARL